MSTFNILKPNTYVFVNEKNINQIMHLKCHVLSDDCNTFNTSMTIPVFNSLKVMKRFKSQILQKNTINENCYVYLDNKNECVASTRVSNTITSIYNTKIEEYDLLDSDYINKLLINKIGIFLINDFVIEEKSIYDLSEEIPLFLTGDIWIPSIKTSDNFYFREMKNNIYEKIYLES